MTFYGELEFVSYLDPTSIKYNCESQDDCHRETREGEGIGDTPPPQVGDHRDADEGDGDSNTPVW